MRERLRDAADWAKTVDNRELRENGCDFEAMFTASIIVPCFDEEATLQESVERVIGIADAEVALEIIIVDDCSRDGSRKIAEELRARHPSVRVFTHDHNLGKGAAIRTGFKNATGEVIAIHDADLEYDPGDLRKLIELIRAGKADVVFGSRFLSAGEHRVLYFWHSMGNRFLTFLSNMFTDLNLSDMEACYKVFRREAIEGIEICEDRFGFEPEIVAKVSERRPRIYEMGIAYFGRTYEDGKKIGFRDGLRALYCIVRYNAHRSPLLLQFCAWLPGALAGIGVGVLAAAGGEAVGLTPVVSGAMGYLGFAIIHEYYSRQLIFRPASRWAGGPEAIWRIFFLAGGAAVASFVGASLAPREWASCTTGFVALGAAALTLYGGGRFAIYSARRK